jgi:hypothetical protein
MNAIEATASLKPRATPARSKLGVLLWNLLLRRRLMPLYPRRFPPVEYFTARRSVALHPGRKSAL